MVRQWVEKADNDLRHARHTLTLTEECPYDTVCFHAQPCAEKYLKALLLSGGAGFPRTHDLRALWQLLAAPTALGIDLHRVLVLNRYSVEARYPGDWEPITPEEAEAAVEIAEELRGAVGRLLSDAALS